MEECKKIGRILLNILIPAAGILLVCLLGPKLLRFFIPFVIGGIIAMIANPLVRFLEKRIRIRRKHSSVILIVGALALVIVGGYFLITAIGREAAGFLQTMPELVQALEGDISQIGANLSRMVERLPAGIQETINGVTSRFGETVGSMVAGIGEPTITAVGNFTRSLPNALVNTVVCILSAYFFLADRDRVGSFFQKFLPASWMKAIHVMRDNTRRIVGGYFSAQFKIMLGVVVVLYIGFLVLRINYAFLLAVLIALLDFLPVFGTGTVLIPWAVFKALSGDFGMTVGLAVIYVVSQGYHQLVQPKMVSDSMDMNPLYTLVLLYLGFRIYGIGGMILAVPVGMIAEELYRAGLFDGMLLNGKLLIREINHLRGLPEEAGPDDNGMNPEQDEV